jgi:hypothetical protein
MIELTITSTAAMGPLNVSVYPPDEDQPIEFTLSSGSTSKTLRARSGRYVVVARRLNGSKLRQFADVDDANTVVDLAEAVQRTPNEFMQRETDRGEIATPAHKMSLDFEVPLSGISANIFGKAITKSVIIDFNERLSKREQFELKAWHFTDDRWTAVSFPWYGVQDAWRSEQFWKISVDASNIAKQPGKGLCVGLLNKMGIGPLVMLPPFADPFEITFVMEGLAAFATDRATTLGQQRVPVALVTLSRLEVADLLSALAASAATSAKAIWSQVAPKLVPNARVNDIVDLLIDKFQRPAEALVAAHYLLRYMPNRLPLRWAENLSRALPTAADGPVIAAWTWIYNRPPSASDTDVEEAVARWITMAFGRPLTLFARTRTLLLEARSFSKDSMSANLQWSKTEAYWRAGAGAGGLEAFWATAPDCPIRWGRFDDCT